MTSAAISERACAWFDAVLTIDAAAHAAMANVTDELFKCLDILVQSGVAHARVLEDRLTNPENSRKAG